MSSYSGPIIDRHNNPFYCPEVPAAVFINSLHANKPRKPSLLGRVGGKRHSHNGSISSRENSFAHSINNRTLVEKEEDYDGDDDLREELLPRLWDVNRPLRYKSKTRRAHRENLRMHPHGSVPSAALRWDTAGSQESATEGFTGEHTNTLSFGGHYKTQKHGASRTESFDDLRGPQRYQKSFETTSNNSFAVDADGNPAYFLHIPPTEKIKSKIKTHEAISQVKVLKDRISYLEDELYGAAVGTESPRGLGPLLARLDAILPGIRLKERLHDLDNHQAIANMLATNGYLNPRILMILRSSEIQRLTLNQSLIDENGLNISGEETFAVFSKPNSFLFLSELSFDGVLIRDFDLCHIHHLPRLSKLGLDNTNIGNEAIYLLIPLKRTLTSLSIASNPRITDIAVPALLLLSKLTYLSITGTGIGMPGLRQFAVAMNEQTTRETTVLIPEECETYVDNIGSQYLVTPMPPLITESKDALVLSKAALIRNLTAHAEVNCDIFIGGEKREMAERLRVILEVRALDRIVLNMLDGGSAEGEQ